MPPDASQPDRSGPETAPPSVLADAYDHVTAAIAEARALAPEGDEAVAFDVSAGIMSAGVSAIAGELKHMNLDAGAKKYAAQVIAQQVIQRMDLEKRLISIQNQWMQEDSRDALAAIRQLDAEEAEEAEAMDASAEGIVAQMTANAEVRREARLFNLIMATIEAEDARDIAIPILVNALAFHLSRNSRTIREGQDAVHDVAASMRQIIREHWDDVHYTPPAAAGADL